MCKKKKKKTITRPSNNTREPYLLNCNGTIFLIENSKIGILRLSTFHTKRKRRRKKHTVKQCGPPHVFYQEKKGKNK